MLSLCLGFRRMAGSRPPTMRLVSLSRVEAETSSPLFPIFLAPSCPNVSEPGNGMMSRLPNF